MSDKQKDKPWTRKELSMRMGFSELAAAVIEQWHKDGEPACDKEAMDYWFKIKQACDDEEKKPRCSSNIY